MQLTLNQPLEAQTCILAVGTRARWRQKCRAALGTSTMKRLLIGSVFILTTSLLASTATVSAQSCAAFGASVARDAKAGAVGGFVCSVASSGAGARANLAAPGPGL